MEAKELKELKKRIELIKLHYDWIADDLYLKAGISKGTLYRLLNGDFSDKTLTTMAENLGVNYEWLKEGKGEMLPNVAKTNQPEITTKSTDPSIKALIQQINFLQAQLIEKDVIIKSLVKPSPRTRHHSVLANRGVLVAARN